MNGSVRNEYDHDTFGTRAHVKTANSGSNQHFGYTGEMFDAESGLLYRIGIFMCIIIRCCLWIRVGCVVFWIRILGGLIV